MKHITKYKVFESESNIIGTIKNRDEIDFDMINDDIFIKTKSYLMRLYLE